MTDGSTGLLVLLLISAASALLWHRFVTAYTIAVIGAGSINIDAVEYD